jgi:hypothetical protein
MTADVNDNATIRLQVYELRPGDLARFPIWEFVLDEEGEEDQDEATVKPRPDLDRADPAEGMFVVHAEFTCADGTRLDGYVSPQDEAVIGYIQPTVVTDEGQVAFWFGGVPPRPGDLETSYRMLGKTARELFPLGYRALVPHGGAALTGELPAFMHLESMESDTVVYVT